MRGQIATLLLLCAALFTLTACEDRAEVAAEPLLYEITNADGEVEGWLIGTM